HLNGQLRYEYPKATNFNTLTDQDIQHTQDRLNHRGRVILAGMTPAEKLDVVGHEVLGTRPGLR
ncbi:hypothetical protein M3C97_011900, partial [Micrococcus luteus]|nr:hypothetical protein [Micrococcus luteus]